jgi:hypothetical protein
VSGRSTSKPGNRIKREGRFGCWKPENPIAFLNFLKPRDSQTCSEISAGLMVEIEPAPIFSSVARPEGLYSWGENLGHPCRCFRQTGFLSRLTSSSWWGEVLFLVTLSRMPHIAPKYYFDHHYLKDFALFGGDSMCGASMSESLLPDRASRFAGIAEFVICQFELNLIHQAIFTHFGSLQPSWRRFSVPFANTQLCFSGHGTRTILRWVTSVNFFRHCRSRFCEWIVG